MKQTYEFQSHPGNLASVRRFVREFLHGALAEKEMELLVLGIDEACTNIIRHAYACCEDQPIHLSCERHDTSLCFRLRDFGRTERETLAGRPLEKVAPGGLGLHLIRQAFDEVTYQPQEPGTELILIKYLLATAKPTA